MVEAADAGPCIGGCEAAVVLAAGDAEFAPDDCNADPAVLTRSCFLGGDTVSFASDRTGDLKGL